LRIEVRFGRLEPVDGDHVKSPPVIAEDPDEAKLRVRQPEAIAERPIVDHRELVKRRDFYGNLVERFELLGEALLGGQASP
jgi:hypothetical protein